MQQMSLGRVRVMQWLLVAVLATAPVYAYALGMGKLVLRSGLDEPLVGDIELSSLSPQELKSLKPSLGSRADFDSAGIERPYFLTGIKYEVTQRAGRSYLHLTTDEPIREPFLHFLLQVEWSGGKLIREYTALLDPPQWAEAKPAEIQSPTVVPESPAITQADAGANPNSGAVTAPDEWTAAPNTTTRVTPEETVAGNPPAEATPSSPAPSSATAPETVSPPPEPATVAAAPAAVERPPETKAVIPAADENSNRGTTSDGDTRAWASTWEYSVKRGDTLGRIASQVRVDKTLTPQQVMIALLRANPSAFYAKNVNNLKAGAILKMPERDEVESISKTSARTEFQAQYQVWQKYKSQVAAASSTVTVPQETPVAPVAQAKEGKTPAVTKPTGKAVEAKAVEASAPIKPATAAKKEAPVVQQAAEGDEDLLKIVRSNLLNTPVPETVKAPGVETRKDAAKEQRALTEKVATLEEAIESKELQNKEMRERVGKMQEQAKNTSRLIDLENKALAEAQKQAVENAKVKPEPVTPVVPPVAAVTAPVAPPKVDAPATPAIPTAPVTAPGASKKPVPRPVAPPPAPETDFVQQITDNLTDNPLLLMVLAGVGVLGAGIFAIHFVRRRRASAEFEESILSGGSIGPDNSSISESTSQPGASDTSFLSDFSQGGMGNVHTDEVDPIAEAEVYLAYGRDEQAEEILKEAVVKDPARHELKQKLLEIYHQRNDVSGFETLAEELYAALEGKGGKVWDKVEEMGRKISPSNPMFRGGVPSGGAGSAARPVELRTSFDRDAQQRAPAPAPSSQSLDFDMGEMLHDMPSSSSGSDRTAPMDSGLDFDLGAPAATPEVSLDMEFDGSAMASSSGAEKSGLDMDFNLNDNEPVPARSSGGIDFDIPSAPHADNEISLDFDTTGGQDTHADEGLTFAMDATAADNPTLEFESSGEELDSDVAVEEQQWDETATKLDLAKAYIDMGDAEGARSILDEVLAEGNESQKRQAHELAEQIH